MRLFKIALFILALFSCKETAPSPQLPKNFQGKVVAVKDGDTIEVLYNNSTIKIRLAHIDCPEIKKGQPYGTAAKQFTSALCFGQQVTVENEGRYDQYKRLIAVIINNSNQNLNKELVKAGLAWHYLKYSSDTAYSKLEDDARQHKAGLWADKNPIPPWDWRKP